MRKLSSMVARFLTQLILCLVFVTAIYFALSSYFFSDIYTGSLRRALSSTLTQAEDLMRRYEAGTLTQNDLHDAANPPLFSGGTFSLFMDADRQMLAQTEVLPVFDQDGALEALVDELQTESFASARISSEGSAYLIMGQRTDKGFAMVGTAMYAYTGAASAFRSRLLFSMAGIAVLIVLLSAWAAQRVSRPVRIITEMASRLTEGERLILPEDLPGRDAKEIAAALNHMSRSVAQAIGDLKYEKETMSLILEGLNEGILAVDGNGNLLHENAASWQLLGGEETEAYRAVMAALRENRAEDQWDGKCVRGNRTLHFTVSRLPLQEEGGISRGVVALIRDITEQERLERTRYDYVANISHELRTPLASIRGLGEGLRDGLVTDEKDRQRCYSIITDEANRLSRLVNDLLELSSLQSNPAAFETEDVDPNEMIYDLHDRNSRLFAQQGLSFLRSLPEEPLPTIRSNEDRLSQVLTIFLDNARKYTPAGGSVVLGAERVPDGVKFFVRDNGIGMDEETQRLAFERFHQADPGRGGKGSGLGLSIAREILQKMGRTIALTSAPGRGSEFSFVIAADGRPA